MKSDSVTGNSSFLFCPYLAPFQIDFDFWQSFFPKVSFLNIFRPKDLEFLEPGLSFNYIQVLDEKDRLQIILEVQTLINSGQTELDSVFNWQTDSEKGFNVLKRTIKNYDKNMFEKNDPLKELINKFFVFALWLLYSHENNLISGLLENVKKVEQNLWADLKGEEPSLDFLANKEKISLLPQRLNDLIWQQWVYFFLKGNFKNMVLLLDGEEFQDNFEIWQPKLLAKVNNSPNLLKGIDFLTVNKRHDFKKVQEEFLEIIDSCFLPDKDSLEVYLLPSNCWKKTVNKEKSINGFWQGAVLKKINIK